jgi:hypothetical protein
MEERQRHLQTLPHIQKCRRAAVQLCQRPLQERAHQKEAPLTVQKQTPLTTEEQLLDMRSMPTLDVTTSV